MRNTSVIKLSTWKERWVNAEVIFTVQRSLWIFCFIGGQRQREIHKICRTYMKLDLKGSLCPSVLRLKANMIFDFAFTKAHAWGTFNPFYGKIVTIYL